MANIKIYGKLKNATESGKVADYADIDGAPEIVQETGQSTEKTMSQKAITDAINAGGGAVYSVIEISTSQTVLTDEQYSILIASPFNKIIFYNIVYNLYQETSGELVYTANLFNRGNRITITKATKGITRGSLDSLTSISSYVKNSLDYAQSNTTYALSAYQGKVLNDRLTALEDSGGGGSTVLPFISFGSTQTTYPITGEFTEEQANKLVSAPFSTITFSPGGSPDQVPMLPQTSEQIHNSYIWKGSDDTYDYTVTATIQPATSPATGWTSKSYTITRNTKSTSTNDVTPAFSLVLPSDVTFPYTGTLTDDQKNLLSTFPIKLKLIDVQIAASNGQSDYNTHYLCSNDYINAQYGTYGSTYWAQYSDTKKIKVAFTYDSYTDGSYTISLVEAGGGGSAELYMHTLQIGSKEQFVQFTIYSNRSAAYDWTSFQAAFSGKDVAIGGNLLATSKFYYSRGFKVPASTATTTANLTYIDGTQSISFKTLVLTVMSDDVVKVM